MNRGKKKLFYNMGACDFKEKKQVEKFKMES